MMSICYFPTPFVLYVPDFRFQVSWGRDLLFVVCSGPHTLMVLHKYMSNNNTKNPLTYKLVKI